MLLELLMPYLKNLTNLNQNNMKVLTQEELQQEALSLSIEINIINKEIKKLLSKRDRRKAKLKVILHTAFNQVEMEFD